LKRFLILLLGAAMLLPIAIAAPVAAGPLEDAVAAYARSDYATALRTFRPLAIQGNAVGQYILGFMYSNGQGVPQDYIEAHAWFALAAAQGDKDAAKSRDEVAKRMTPAQIAEAQKLAREWRPRR
jgi:TPR repeat protein